MYPNILISILILLVAFQVIGGMLSTPKLIKAASVGIVLLVAVALIIWLLMGLSPIPPWIAKFVVKIYREASAAASSLDKAK
jgi:predicted tellurium resistance membrane protein TerC